MTTHYSFREIDERAFTFFIRDGLQYVIDHNIGMKQSTVMSYLTELRMAWFMMKTDEKELYRVLAAQQMEQGGRRRYIINKVLDSILDDAARSK